MWRLPQIARAYALVEGQQSFSPRDLSRAVDDAAVQDAVTF